MKGKTMAVLWLATLAVLGAWAIVHSSDAKIGADCTFNGKKMFGKVQIVEHFPDVKIQIVEHFPDLKVEKVEIFPDSCGKWQFVDHFPDFTVQIVEHFPDVKIQYVTNFPGLP